MANYTDVTGKPPKEWIDALDQGLADLAAKRVVDGAAVHVELRASIERMERDERQHRRGSSPAAGL